MSADILIKIKTLTGLIKYISELGALQGQSLELIKDELIKFEEKIGGSNLSQEQLDVYAQEIESSAGILKTLIQNASKQKPQLTTTLLRIAAAKGDTPTVAFLLSLDNIDVNAADIYGNTALIWAAKNRRSLVVEQLINTPGIDIVKEDNFFMSALNWAKYKKHEYIVAQLYLEQLLAVEFKTTSNLVINDQDKNIYDEIRKRNAYVHVYSDLILEAFLKKYEKIDSIDEKDKFINQHKCFAIYCSTRDLFPKAVPSNFYLRLKEKGYIDQLKQQLRTAEQERSEAVGPLLQSNDSANQLLSSVPKSINTRKESLLNLIKLAKMYEDIAQKFLDVESKVSVLSEQEVTPTIYEEKFQQLSNLMTDRKQDVFWHATRVGDKMAVEYFLKDNEIDVNQITDFASPLVCATKLKHKEIVELLVKQENIDINGCTRNEFDYNALMYAIENLDFSMFTLLLLHPALIINKEFKSSYGNVNPVRLAAIYGNIPMLAMLLQDKKSENSTDNTPSPMEHQCWWGQDNQFDSAKYKFLLSYKFYIVLLWIRQLFIQPAHAMDSVIEGINSNLSHAKIEFKTLTLLQFFGCLVEMLLSLDIQQQKISLIDRVLDKRWVFSAWLQKEQPKLIHDLKEVKQYYATPEPGENTPELSLSNTLYPYLK